jgi:hypothetical protein
MLVLGFMLQFAKYFCFHLQNSALFLFHGRLLLRFLTFGFPWRRVIKKVSEAITVVFCMCLFGVAVEIMMEGGCVTLPVT